MNSLKTNVSTLAILFIPMFVAFAEIGVRGEETTPSEPSGLVTVTNVADTTVSDDDPPNDIVQTFRRKARDFVATHYDFHLGLRGESPQHSVLKALLRELQLGLQKTCPDSGFKSFVLAKLEAAHRLENEGQLRRAVNELAFCLDGVPRLDSDKLDSQPTLDILVEEPWRKVKPKELVLACNTQQLLTALISDSTPDNTKTGIEVYRRLSDASALIIEEILDDNEGATKAELLEIEQAAEWDSQGVTIEEHPVVIFRITKTFLDKFDVDDEGNPKTKSFTFRLRQHVQTKRDENGHFTEHLVTNEMLDPVVVGGSRAKGYYGLHFYKTVLSVQPVDGDENATRVQFRVLSIPDFRGRLAKSRIRQAISIFIHLENRRLKTRTLARVAEHWPRRVADSDAVVASP